MRKASLILIFLLAIFAAALPAQGDIEIGPATKTDRGDKLRPLKTGETREAPKSNERKPTKVDAAGNVVEDKTEANSAKTDTASSSRGSATVNQKPDAKDATTANAEEPEEDTAIPMLSIVIFAVVSLVILSVLGLFVFGRKSD